MDPKEFAQRMTCTAVFAASDSTRITPTELNVLMLIAKGYAKRADMAEKIGKKVVTVARAISKLVELGWVKRVTQDGKPSLLSLNETRIIRDCRITHDTGQNARNDTTKAATRRTKDTATQRIDDTPASNDTSGGAPDDTGQKPAHIEHARAGAAVALNYPTSPVESYSEPLEPYDTPPRANTKGMSLVRRVCALVNSPWLDPDKSEKLTTKPAKLAKWAQQLDIETELVPILQAKLACNGTEPIASWNYFEFAVIEYIRDKEADHDPANVTRNQRTPHRGRARSAETELLMRDMLEDPSSGERLALGAK